MTFENDRNNNNYQQSQVRNVPQQNSNKNTDTQRSNMFPESDIFEEKFDN